MKNRILDELLAAGLGERRPEPGESKDASEIVQRSLDRSQELAEQFIKAHPALCLGAAVAFGITLGWWIKRK